MLCGCQGSAEQGPSPQSLTRWLCQADVSVPGWVGRIFRAAKLRGSGPPHCLIDGTGSNNNNNKTTTYIAP